MSINTPLGDSALERVRIQNLSGSQKVRLTDSRGLRHARRHHAASCELLARTGDTPQFALSPNPPPPLHHVDPGPPPPPSPRLLQGPRAQRRRPFATNGVFPRPRAFRARVSARSPSTGRCAISSSFSLLSSACRPSSFPYSIPLQNSPPVLQSTPFSNCAPAQ